MVSPPATSIARLQERLLVPLAVLAVTHLVGTVGFWLSWRAYDASVLDALFMTFITIATIGYGEVHPLGTAGRIVAMVVAAGGIGTVGYTFGVVLDFLVNEQLTGARRMQRMFKQIDRLSGHTIVAGLGRVGKEAADELSAAGRQWVLIDPNEEVVRQAIAAGHPAVRGDATDDATLRSAGVERASGLIVTTNNDATNLYVILSARLLNPKLHIVSRAVDDATIPKMIRAGANRAISPYALGGRRLAHLLVSPRAVDFLETAMRSGQKSLSISDVAVTASVAGKSLAALQLRSATGATVLAVLGDGGSVTVPTPELMLQVGDHLLALGTAEQLAALEAVLNP